MQVHLAALPTAAPPSSHFPPPTSCFLLPTSYFLLPTSYFLLVLLPTSYTSSAVLGATSTVDPPSINGPTHHPLLTTPRRAYEAVRDRNTDPTLTRSLARSGGEAEPGDEMAAVLAL